MPHLVLPYLRLVDPDMERGPPLSLPKTLNVAVRSYDRA
jgi:hypothetical protein